MRSPARSCTRCAAARWPRCARCRSAAITAASMRRRCSCCWSANISGAPAMSRRLPSCGRTSRRRCVDRRLRRPDRRRLCRISRATRTGSGQSGMEGFLRRDLPCRRPAGRRLHRAGEVQGYVYAAKRLAARCARRWGCASGRASSRPRRSRLQSGSKRRSGARNSSTYALALDGAKTAMPGARVECRAGAVHRDRAPERARRVADDLMPPRFLHRLGHPHRGARRGALQSDVLSQRLDLAARQRADRLGLARYGLKQSVAQVFKALFDAATYMDLRRLPELFCGFRRERDAGRRCIRSPARRRPGRARRRSCLLQAALGLEFDADHGEIRLRNPRLPAFLNEVVLRDLKLGTSSADLRLRRHGDEVSLEVMKTRGKIQVSIALSR